MKTEKLNSREKAVNTFCRYVLTVALAAWAASASGAIVSFGFSGFVNYTSNPSNALPSGIVYGSPFTGVITYDAGAIVGGADFSSSTNQGDFYFGTNGGFGIAITVAGHTFTSIKHTAAIPYADIIIKNDYFGEDGFSAEDGLPNILLDGGAFSGNPDAGGVHFELVDTNATAFDIDALPSQAPVLGAFNSTRRIEINALNNHNQLFDLMGIVTNISTAQPVLTIQAQANNTMLLSWPWVYQGFGLQQNTNLLESAGWETNSTPVADTPTEHTVSVPASGPERYFRLIMP